MSSEDNEWDVMIDEENEDYLLALSLQTIENEFNSNVNKDNNNSIESDHKFALQLSQIDDSLDANKAENEVKTKDMSIVSPQLEVLDPSPDIWKLMKQFDEQFFSGILSKHCIELSWSPRMTLTAGLCAWNPRTNYCSIRLSLPLLQLRSRKDLVETLIHEMIHALLFVTKKDDNHESHGPLFHEHMYRINRESGTNITVYHNFHEEVNHYKRHVWRCEGICKGRAPYFGYVRRAMNRKPGPYDYWFKYHEMTCGGNFVKISEPSKEEKNNNKRKEVPTPQKVNNHDIRDYMSPHKSQDFKSSNSVPKVLPFSGNGFTLGTNQSKNNSNDKNHDIRDYLSPHKSHEFKSSNNVSKVFPFSGKGFKLGFNQSKNNLRDKKPYIKPNIVLENFKRVDTNKSQVKEVPTPEKLNNHDIRNYLNSQNSHRINSAKSVAKVLSFSENEFKSDSNQSNNNSVNEKTFIKPNLQLDEPKSVNIDSNSKSREKLESITNSSCNDSDHEISANIRTISSEKTIVSKPNPSSTFIPFSGRGNVLGTIKSENDSFKRTNNSSSQKSKPFSSKSSSLNRNEKKENIILIELD